MTTLAIRRGVSDLDTKLVLFLSLGVLVLVGGTAIFIDSMPERIATTDSPIKAAALSKPTYEMHIANNGLISMRGARITSISGNSLTAVLSWGSQSFTWNITTSPGSKGTTFLNKAGEKISFTDLQVGSYISIAGLLDTSAPDPAIAAQIIRSL